MIMPVDAINDIIKAIWALSASKKYAQGRLKPPARKVALIPITPYKQSVSNDTFSPNNPRIIQITIDRSKPNTASI